MKGTSEIRKRYTDYLVLDSGYRKLVSIEPVGVNKGLTAQLAMQAQNAPL